MHTWASASVVKGIHLERHIGWVVKIVYMLICSLDYVTVFGNREFGQSFAVQSSSNDTSVVQKHTVATVTVQQAHARPYDFQYYCIGQLV